MNVAIVNDSKAAAEVLRRILAEAPGFDLLWTAYSGEDALTLCNKAHPDVILMDLIMPGINGAETTRRIMQTHPCVILVVTATTVGNRDLVFQAMGFGALDAVNTPTLGMNGDMGGADLLLQKLRTVARLVQPSRAKAPALSPFRRDRGTGARHEGSRVPFVAIGASTGGPQALGQILADLPANFPAAVLIAQHVDEHFAPGLAAWLQDQTPHTVRIATQGEPINRPGVWIAGSKDHLIYKEGGFLGYTAHPRETPYRPSVDALFRSLAMPDTPLKVAVLLTGMGRDGAEGLLALRNAGVFTIAQDAATSVVYGMPKAAAELKAASEVLPLGSIGARIRETVMGTFQPATSLQSTGQKR